MHTVLKLAPAATVALTLLAGQSPAYDEPLRPQFHFTPARNFMNDPNGSSSTRASTTCSISTIPSARRGVT